MLCPAPTPLPPYVPNCGPCAGGGGGGGCLTSVQLVALCDVCLACGDSGEDLVNPFHRYVVTDCNGAIIGTIDTGQDAVTPYVVTGTVFSDCPCPVSASLVTQPRHALLDGAGTWVMPANALAVTIICNDLGAVGSATVTDIDGAVPLRDGGVLSWSVVRDQDSMLNPPLRVDTTLAGDHVVILWTEQV